MTASLQLVMAASDWLTMFLHFLSLSLLSVGGAISTVPDMHRFLVADHHWLTDTQFNASIALAQAAPGPNVLFIALLGWNVGLNAGGTLTGMFGALLALLGILLPSTTLAYVAAQWGQRNRERLSVRAFKQGMAPVVVGLMLATSWILALSNGNQPQDWPVWALSAATALIVWRSNLHLLWLMGAGALLGWFGLV